MKMGIANYNAECRKIVMRYAGDWETIVNRMGRWIGKLQIFPLSTLFQQSSSFCFVLDFENDYKTLYPWFMESIWWVFKQLFEKGLVYRGFKVMPFSTACSTPLSNFESGQNYKEVVDPAGIIHLQKFTFHPINS
jgi:isoleucyl-tRNA synthetase